MIDDDIADDTVLEELDTPLDVLDTTLELLELELDVLDTTLEVLELELGFKAT